MQSNGVATQFTLDFEFSATFVGHAFVIFMLVFFLARPNTVWRWIGLPCSPTTKKTLPIYRKK